MSRVAKQVLTLDRQRLDLRAVVALVLVPVEVTEAPSPGRSCDT